MSDVRASLFAMPEPKYFDPAPPSDALVVWVIYRRPSDLPAAEFVVRPPLGGPALQQKFQDVGPPRVRIELEYSLTCL